MSPVQRATLDRRLRFQQVGLSQGQSPMPVVFAILPIWLRVSRPASVPFATHLLLPDRLLSPRILQSRARIAKYACHQHKKPISVHSTNRPQRLQGATISPVFGLWEDRVQASHRWPATSRIQSAFDPMARGRSMEWVGCDPVQTTQSAESTSPSSNSAIAKVVLPNLLREEWPLTPLSARLSRRRRHRNSIAAQRM